MKKIVIFLNGKHVSHTLKVQTNDVSFPFIQKSQTSHDDKTIIFAADNGFKRVLKENIKYSKLHLFGDFDSLSDTHLKKARASKNIVIDLFAKEKNLSDFGCILDHIRDTLSSAQPFFIEIYGGLGNARDHEYANIKEAEYFLSQSSHGGIIVFQGSLILSTLPFSVKEKPDTHFSVFGHENLDFTILNAKYSGNTKLSRPSHGLSNEVEKSPLIIEREASPQILTLMLR